MKRELKVRRTGLSAALVMSLGLAAASQSAFAQSLPRSVANLKGTWVAALQGNTGCGDSAMLVKFKLDSAGSGTGTASITSHSVGCPDKITPGLDFNIMSLNGDGSGIAGLTCGAGCAWILSMQVNNSYDAMILTDVEPKNPKNTPTGAAFKQRN